MNLLKTEPCLKLMCSALRNTIIAPVADSQTKLALMSFVSKVGVCFVLTLYTAFIFYVAVCVFMWHFISPSIYPFLSVLQQYYCIASAKRYIIFPPTPSNSRVVQQTGRSFFIRSAEILAVQVLCSNTLVSPSKTVNPHQPQGCFCCDSSV